MLPQSSLAGKSRGLTDRKELTLQAKICHNQSILACGLIEPRRPPPSRIPCLRVAPCDAGCSRDARRRPGPSMDQLYGFACGRGMPWRICGLDQASLAPASMAAMVPPLVALKDAARGRAPRRSRQSIKGWDTVGEVMGSTWERGGVGGHFAPEVSRVAPPAASAPACA
jgi:hypothetical protein